MKEVLHYARSRGIFTGMSILPNNVPANLARFTRKHGPRPFQGVYGATVSPTDPVAFEINEQRLNAIFDTYPDIDYLFVFGAEDYDVCRHPDSVKLYDRLKPSFVHARQTRPAAAPAEGRPSCTILPRLARGETRKTTRGQENNGPWAQAAAGRRRSPEAAAGGQAGDWEPATPPLSAILHTSRPPATMGQWSLS